MNAGEKEGPYCRGRESNPHALRHRILSPPPDFARPDAVVSCDDPISTPTSRADSRNDLDADVERILDAWPTLPTALKSGILAMIDAALK